MKTKMMLGVVLVLLLPMVSYAQYTVEVSVQGTVGDFATSSRDYVIDGQMYDLPNTIKLFDTAGNQLDDFDRIKGGSVIKVIGEKIIGGSENGTIKWKKIILIKE